METNKIINGDCIEQLKLLPDNSVDAIVTDPPYGLEFMGKEWDKLWDKRKDTEDTRLTGTGKLRNAPTYKAGSQAQDFHTSWAKECLRVLKPGGHLLAFGGSRTYHRLASGVEDAGFEIRDQIMWIYGSGFPKSMNIGKAIDKMQGNEREWICKNPAWRKGNGDGATTSTGWAKPQRPDKDKGNTEWEGWGTGLKPAHEPIVVARKPLAEKNVALNVLKYGTGGINIEDSRIGVDKHIVRGGGSTMNPEWGFNEHSMGQINKEVTGRFPANIILECTCADKEHDEQCPCGIMDLQSGNSTSTNNIRNNNGKEQDIVFGKYNSCQSFGFNDSGGASRYFQNIHLDENCPCRIMDEQSGLSKSSKTDCAGGLGSFKNSLVASQQNNKEDYLLTTERGHNDFGGASRFFYCAKASSNERNIGLEDFPKHSIREQEGDMSKWDLSPEKVRARMVTAPQGNIHPTVKPIKLMEYLINLVSREGSIILDPFLGSGTTAIACLKKNRQFIGIEKNQEYIKIAEARIKPFLVQKTLNTEVVKHE